MGSLQQPIASTYGIFAANLPKKYQAWIDGMGKGFPSKGSNLGTNS